MFAILFAPVGIILGHVANAQIKRSDEGGGGLAKAALIIGYTLVLLPLTVLSIVMSIVAISTHDQEDKIQIWSPSTVTSTTVEGPPPATPGAMPANPRIGRETDWTNAGPIGHRGADAGTFPPLAVEQISP